MGGGEGWSEHDFFLFSPLDKLAPCLCFVMLIMFLCVCICFCFVMSYTFLFVYVCLVCWFKKAEKGLYAIIGQYRDKNFPGVGL